MRQIRSLFLLLITLLIAAGITGCQNAPASSIFINITLIADGKQADFKVPVGSTVQSALDLAKITLNNLDRVDPPTYSLLSDGTTIQVVRVIETFEVEEIVLPFEHQTVPNESLPEGQRLLVQAGANGLQQITYRSVSEDGVEISRNVFKVTTITEAKPEIEMVGVQLPFTSIPISGKLAYLAGGNAWIMDGSTGNRRPIVTTADLDGRVFSISPDQKWLLFTRKPKTEQADLINTLWVIDISEEESEPINLTVTNIIHFANWYPGKEQTILYSTVEPRSTPPGWQANNDLTQLRFYASGTTRIDPILETNIGGIYGWWGTNFSFSPEGSRLAFARPDSIGLIDLKTDKTTTIADIIPLQTRSDWAWVPGMGWSPDGEFLYFVNHAPLSTLSNNESSPMFNLDVLIPGGASYSLVQQTGMFTYPVPSPEQGKNRYQIAYLQAFFPEQSENSRYRLMVMDRDGSNRRVLFPAEGLPGLDPQKLVWTQEQLPDSPWWIAFIYQGNLWFTDPDTGAAQQITGDGLITSIDWK